MIVSAVSYCRSLSVPQHAWILWLCWYPPCTHVLDSCLWDPHVWSSYFRVFQLLSFCFACLFPILLYIIMYNDNKGLLVYSVAWFVCLFVCFLCSCKFGYRHQNVCPSCTSNLKSPIRQLNFHNFILFFSFGHHFHLRKQLFYFRISTRGHIEALMYKLVSSVS